MKNNLNVEPNVSAPDEIYESLISMHEGLGEDESAIVNARMILLLANHIGDTNVIREAAVLARHGR